MDPASRDSSDPWRTMIGAAQFAAAKGNNVVQAQDPQSAMLAAATQPSLGHNAIMQTALAGLEQSVGDSQIAQAVVISPLFGMAGIDPTTVLSPSGDMEETKKKLAEQVATLGSGRRGRRPVCGDRLCLCGCGGRLPEPGLSRCPGDLYARPGRRAADRRKLIRVKRIGTIFLAILLVVIVVGMLTANGRQVDPAEYFADPQTIALAEAMLSGDTSRMEELVCAGADPNARGVDGMSLARLAHAAAPGCRTRCTGAGMAARPCILPRNQNDSYLSLLVEAGGMSMPPTHGWRAARSSMR